jgi:Flp pilus assembly protein TadG
MSRHAHIEGAVRFRRREEGNALVEFGLLLPFLLILLLGIIDWGHVHFARLTITNAAREGARVGVTRATPQVAEAEAEARAREYLVNSGIQGAEVRAAMHDTVQDGLTVTVTLPFRPLIGFVPTPDTLEVRSVMRWELAP